MAYKDTVPVNQVTKASIKRLQSKMAVLKGLPSSLSQIDVMEMMTLNFEETVNQNLTKIGADPTLYQ